MANQDSDQPIHPKSNETDTQLGISDPRTSIQVSGSLPVADFYRAGRLAARRTFWPILLVALAFVAFEAFLIYVAISSSSFAPDAALRILAVAVAVLVAMGFPLIWQRIQVERNFRRKVGWFANVDLTVTDEGIDAKCGMISSRVAWRTWIGCRVSDRVAILYSSLANTDLPPGSLVVSRSQFKTVHDWDEFRRLLETHVRRLNSDRTGDQRNAVVENRIRDVPTIGQSPNSGDDAVPTTVIRISDEMPLADYYHARKLAAARPRLRARIPVSLGIITVFVLVIIALNAYRADVSNVAMNRLLVGGTLAYVMVLASHVIWTVIWTRMKIKQCFDLRVGSFSFLESTITDEGITTTTESGSRHIPWTGFVGFRVSDRVAVLFFQLDDDYLIVSRAKFKDSAGWHSFIAVLDKKLPKILRKE